MEQSRGESANFGRLIEQRLAELNLYLQDARNDAGAFEIDIAKIKLDIWMKEAKTKKELAEHYVAAYGAHKRVLLFLESQLYHKREPGEKASDELSARLAQLSSRLDSFEKETNDLNTEIQSLQDQYNEARKKREKASTWYYMIIPGYNLYLALDAEINASDERLQALKHRLENREHARQALLDEVRQTRQAFLNSQDESSKYASAIAELKKTLLEITDKISESKKSLVAWNELYIQYGTMKQELEINGTLPPCFLKQITI